MENKKTTTLPPYAEIPAAPANYNAANATARSIDGLGYRFYWATDELTDNELDFEPGNENRTPREVMDHFVGLSETILNTVNNEHNIRPYTEVTGTFEDKRLAVLNNLKMASDKLRTLSNGDIENIKLTFERGEKISEFPFWNLINGPIADAIYHTGQIVAQRRSAGNPINPNVNVFTGINKK
ncbi:MAG: hypothetical protein ACI81Y_002215 [Glaciecola sp.]|jgi:hypothetical protein